MVLGLYVKYVCWVLYMRLGLWFGFVYLVFDLLVCLVYCDCISGCCLLVVCLVFAFVFVLLCAISLMFDVF